MNPMSEFVLETKNLGISFGGLRAVSQVNLQVKKGEIYGLIGPNGAGKTTIFNLLTGVYQPTEGTFSLNGKELKQELAMAVRKTELPFGIFTWSDSHFCVIVKPVLDELGITPEKYRNLGNFNTFHAVENNFSSFDLRIGEICKIAVDMLVGNTDERNVILNAKLIER